MKVFVDARWTRTDHYDGISRYGAGLVEALHRRHPVTVLVHDRRQLRLLPEGVPHVVINSPFSVRELLLSRTLHRLGADVVFTPLQVIGGFRRRYALIVTVHDLIYYRYRRPPDFLPWPVRLVWRLYHRVHWPQRLLLDRADAVVSVSRTTARLLAELRMTRRPVVVVPNAPANPPQRSRIPERVRTRGGERGLVYMGSFLPYKNVEALIAGMAFLSGYRLHLLSSIEPEREAELAAQIPPGGQVEFWRGVSEDEYAALLEHASALVTASYDEGFGLPLAEAMRAGTPVVCSDLPVFREVTGGHAQFFDPASPRTFAEALRALEDSQVREEVVTAGRRHVEGYSWDSSAQRLLDLMRELSGKDRRKSTADSPSAPRP